MVNSRIHSVVPKNQAMFVFSFIPINLNIKHNSHRVFLSGTRIESLKILIYIGFYFWFVRLNDSLADVDLSTLAVSTQID